MSTTKTRTSMWLYLYSQFMEITTIRLAKDRSHHWTCYKHPAWSTTLDELQRSIRSRLSQCFFRKAVQSSRYMASATFETRGCFIHGETVTSNSSSQVLRRTNGSTS